MKIIAILRNREMFEILKKNINGFETFYFSDMDTFLKNIGSLEKNSEFALIVNAGMNIPREVFSLANIILIQQFGVGYENIDIDFVSKKNIPVFIVPTESTANALSCAELALFFSLALSRNYNGCINSINHGAANQPMGNIISGKKFGVIGLGGVGREIIRLLKPFGVKIYGIKKTNPPKNFSDDLGIEFIGAGRDNFIKILPEMDYLVFALPLNKETSCMMNYETISICKNGVYIINVGRAGVIEKGALISGLKTGRVSGAGLDVFWEEPIRIDNEIFHFNIIATPHIGGATFESIDDIAKGCVFNIKRFIENGSLDNCVNKESLSAVRGRLTGIK